MERARTEGLLVSTVLGTSYQHLVLTPAQAPSDGPLHVYIDHDGLPWQSVELVSPDPTPRRALALDLLVHDTTGRMYLGRPCYFGHTRDAGCGQAAWTSHRYSAEVVSSMAAAVNRLTSDRRAHRPVVLIGYSGGGTLAWLMAPQVVGATTVVTVAANLNVGGWTDWHGYSALDGSRDPGIEPPLPPEIRQVHLVGGRDARVPPSLTHAFVRRQPGAALIEIGEFGHVCCWTERWPALLQAALETTAAPAPSAGGPGPRGAAGGASQSMRADRLRVDPRDEASHGVLR